MHPKQFRVQICAYKHYADFTIKCLELPLDIENAIVDKLGENSIKWEYLGEMNDPKINRITYEEVINGDANTSIRPLHTEKRSGSRMGAGAS